MRRLPAGLWQWGPTAVFFGVFFVAPLCILFVYSFWTQSGFDVVPDVTLSNYITGATTGLYAAVLARTIAIGLIIHNNNLFCPADKRSFTNYWRNICIAPTERMMAK